MPSAFLITKLRPPRVRPGIVPRARLVQRLSQGQAHPLLLISAPAGFGKTTLVADWIRQNSATHTAWLSLDLADNQPNQFWQSVIATLELVAPAVCQEAKALLRLPNPPAIQTILTALINDLAQLPDVYAIILDDYHLIEKTAIHEAISFLIEYMPSNLQLIILTRSDPPFPLARLRARNLITEVRAHDLRFATDEIAAFFANAGALQSTPALSEQDLTILEQRTEGWIAGLQLALLSLRGCADVTSFIQNFSGNNKQVLDYLTSEVLEHQPPAVQHFLLQTSILDRMCAELCDALLADENIDNPLIGIGTAQATLAALERANLFVVALDEEGRWYRYHPLFADLLRKRLRQNTPVAVDELHRRAAHWCEQAGLLDLAVQHLFASADPAPAVAFIERHATAAWLRADLRQLQGWLMRLPAGVIESTPVLALAQLWLNIISRQLQDVEQAIAATPALQRARSPIIAGEVALLRSTVALFHAEFSNAIHHAEAALHLLASQQPTQHELALRAVATLNLGLAQRRQGNRTSALTLLTEAARLAQGAAAPYVALVALENLGSYQVRHGTLLRAVETYQQARAISASLGASSVQAAGVIDIALSEIYYEQNQLEQVGQLVPDALKQLRQLMRGMEPGPTVRGYSLLAKTALALGNSAAAHSAMHECEVFLERLPQPTATITALWAIHKSRLWLQQGDLMAATRWVESLAVTEEMELTCFQQLTLVRLRLAQFRQQHAPAWVEEATTALAAALATAEQNGWLTQQIEGLLLQSLLQQATNQTKQAVTTLLHALTLAHTANYVRTIVDLGKPMAELIMQVQAQGRLLDYCRQLLAAFPTAALPALSSPPAPRQHAELVEPISPREMDVLHLVALGKSNQEIADTLFISLGTVKSHTNSLFGKLGVASRTQAAARARELGLL
jgi:LuxR family maltose regulon positive regulatory protein